MSDNRDIVERLRAACAGHPAAEVQWPHRLLHDAASEIEWLRQHRNYAKGALAKVYLEMLQRPTFPEHVRAEVEAVLNLLDGCAATTGRQQPNPPPAPMEGPLT